MNEVWVGSTGADIDGVLGYVHGELSRGRGAGRESLGSAGCESDSGFCSPFSSGHRGYPGPSVVLPHNTSIQLLLRVSKKVTCSRCPVVSSPEILLTATTA